MKKKRFGCLLLSCILLVSCFFLPAQAASIKSFTDVPAHAWYYDAVNYVVKKDLFSGISDTEFGPSLPMTRGMFVTVLARKSNVNYQTYNYDCKFDDVGKKYYAPYINWATTFEIVSGVGDNKFNPEAPITREQMAKILYEYAVKTGNETIYSDSKYTMYLDTAKVSEYAVGPMKWATIHGIINGVGGYFLEPKSTATRAQVAQIMKASANVLYKTEIITEITPPSPEPSNSPEPTVSPTPTVTPKPTVAPTQKPDIDAEVYWLPTGTVYHSTKSCRSLSRSDPAKIKAGTVSDANRAGITKPCPNCH